MPKIKLIYFDFDGGRGETARLAMHIGGVPFEDQRVTFPQWRELKGKMPFGGMPVLDIDGRLVAQSNSINRYVGKLAGLYPEDNLQSLLCDEVMDAVEDVSTKMANTMGMEGEALKTAREALAEGPIPLYLKSIGKRLAAAGGEYFAGGRLTVADIKVALWIRWLRSGALDHVPSDLPDRHAPGLVKHFETVMGHPKIKAYYEARKKA